MEKERMPAPRIGEVYHMRFDGDGSEQSGWRPGLVFQNNMGNLHSPNVIALPFTGSIKKLGQPTHVLVRAEESGLKIDSVVLCENPQRMSKEKIGRFITKLSRKQMREIAAASLIASSAIAYLDLDALILAWRKAILLNFDSLEQTDDRPEVWNV